VLPVDRLRVAVVGPGAVGGLLGALLARAGHSVAFVAHGESLAVLRAAGVTVTSPEGTFATGPLEASPEPRDLGERDAVFVCVKAWQVEAIAPSLKPLVGSKTIVAPMQNGVEAAGHLSRALGEEPVVGSFCRVLAAREAPGRVQTLGTPLELVLGERTGGVSPRIERLGAAARAAGIVVKLSDDIAAALWSKLLFVEPLGSVGAVTRATVDVVRSLPETRALLEGAMREVQAVAGGRGVHLPDDAVARALARVDAMPLGSTASMHRDIVEGRPSELNEQTGAVVRAGKETGVARPIHDFLWASLVPQEARLRRR
jgi:2-dehydropantoate 2-reductase